MKKLLKIVGFSVLGLIVLVIGIAVLVSIFVPEEELEEASRRAEERRQERAEAEKQKPTPAPMEKPKPTPPPPELVEFKSLADRSVHQVHAITLAQEYKDNEFAADEKYKGKIILVRGNITNFADTLGVPSIQLETNQMLTSIVCAMKKSQRPLLAKLSKGQDVLVVGKLTGMSLGISIDMKDCLVGSPK